MNPDPNLVVKALLGYADLSLTNNAAIALPHAEAIAEMWADLQEPRNMTLAEWKNVQELITAAREMERAVTEEGCDAGDLVPTCFGGRALPRLRAALKNLEEA